MARVWQVGNLCLIGAIAALAVACGGGSDDGNGGGGGGGGGGNVPVGTQAPATPRPTMDPAFEAAESATATIASFGGSTVGGTATVTKQGGGSEITIEATGLPDGTHSAFLKAGGCEGGGQRVGPLGDLAASGGNATLTTPLPATRLAVLLNGAYHVVIYEGGSSGPVIGCGPITL